MARVHAPPVEQLRGSVFPDFTIPGLSLLLVVGGSAVLATVLLVRASRFALLGAALARAAVMSFEFVEVLAIGSPGGAARVMQILYFLVGLALVAVSLGTMFVDLLRKPPAPPAQQV